MAEQDTATGNGEALPRWLEELRPGTEGAGFLEKRLRHSLLFVERPVKRLLVTFDNLSNVGDASMTREPWGFKFAQDCNIAHLGVMAHVSDWYRDPDLIDRMRKLADDGFFDGYDRVVMAGVSMGGFAAIAFASLVPGAHVVSVNPQSTLDPDIVPWESRYENGRRQDWTLPLSDAAALTGGLGRVNIFYDPYHALDRQHVARFSGDNIRVFNCRYSNHKTAVFLRKIGALKPVMERAIFDELTAAEFYRLYRARRDLRWFRGALVAHFQEQGRDEMAARATRAFRTRLRERREAPAAGGPPQPAAAVPEKTAPAVLQARRGNARRAIVTTMKNEGPFMLEWVAYNRAIGFTDFLIYTNNCDDGTDRIGARLEELGLARHVDNRFKTGASPQRVALRRALKEPVYQEADWIICADCDEFLKIRTGQGRLDDLFAAVGEADAISLCWKIFGCGGVAEYADRPVIEQFVWAAPEDYTEKYRARGLKTLFRPSEAIVKIGVHRPKFDGRPDGFVWRDAGGRDMPGKYFEAGWSAYPKFSHDHARLHHYAVRSVDSFLVKRDRGRTNHVDRDQGVAYWADMNLNMAEDRSLLPMVAAMQRELDGLLADPELARLHAAACDWHRARIKSLKAREDWSALHDLLQQINRPGEMPVNRDRLLQDLAAE
ncbi:MAG: glycosyltransferase family 2 protein [Roseovarius sp.]|nr:glycosyltransferase family 2 protein [Roseovarius sp.]